MKRPYCIMLALALAASLAACGGPDGNAPSATAAPEAAATAETAPAEETAAPAEETAALPAVAGELYPILPADDTHMWFNTGTRGYQMKWENDHGLVMVIDYDTAEQRVLCSVPGCTHDAEPCPAYFPGVRQNCQLFVAGEEVYLYKRWEGEYLPDTWEEYEQSMQLPQGTQPQDAEEEMAFRRAYYEQAVKPAGLMVVAADGSAKRYVELSQNLGVDSWLRWCDGAALYGSEMQAGGKAVGYRVSLADGSVTTFALQPYEWVTGAEGNRLLTRRIVTQTPLPDPTIGENQEAYQAVLQTAVVEYDWLDPATGERSKILERPHDGSTNGSRDFYGLWDGKLYFEEQTSASEGGPYQRSYSVYDSAAGTWQDLPKPLPDPTMTLSDPAATALPEIAARQGRYLRFHGSDNVHGENLAWVLDQQAGELTAMPMEENADSGAPWAVTPCALTNDGRFLVQTAYREGRYAYALIGAEAFLQGSTDYTPVKMLA